LLIKLVHMIVVQFSMSFVIRLLFVSSLFIISHPLAFVKRFFQTFLSFFADPLGLAFPLVGSLYIISQPLPFVKGFFKLFPSFLRFLFGSARSLVDSLYSISHQVNFVKSFLKLFSSFFDLLFDLPLSLRQPDYYITLTPTCQYLFPIFFNFFRQISNLLSLTSHFLSLTYSHIHPNTSAPASYPCTYLLSWMHP